MTCWKGIAKLLKCKAGFWVGMNPNISACVILATDSSLVSVLFIACTFTSFLKFLVQLEVEF